MMRMLHAGLIAISSTSCLTCGFAEEAIDPGRAANTIILDENGVRNLGIKTVAVEEQEFETTVFAIGRIEEIPVNRSVLSSRISGRAIKVNAFEGDHVQQGQVLVEVESRQPGDPPPVISLKAAQDGIVIASHVRVGQPIEPDTELLDISERSEMWAVAKIPEKEASTIKIGTRARIQVPALGGDPIEATLTRFGIMADREAGTVEGIFQIPNIPEGRLQPGMRAEFSIIVGMREDVMAVPRTALQGDPSKRVVFVKDFDLPNAFVKAPVQVGEQNDGFIEIVSGLFPGDEVVTQGSYSLGFAGGGSVSLKEALDAAHGHEHNEDGSELTPDEKAAKEGGGDGHDHEAGGKMNRYLQIYAVVISLLFIIVAQLLWRNRKAKA
ncbi:MAG: efflux RND transporter periplasmic adaptor subunit [Verrucomicrobiae bacterium]|nr:efflux RND transporter periplasmic adaptor subunit [Verrucomicrobiae bacterium]